MKITLILLTSFLLFCALIAIAQAKAGKPTYAYDDFKRKKTCNVIMTEPQRQWIGSLKSENELPIMKHAHTRKNTNIHIHAIL